MQNKVKIGKKDSGETDTAFTPVVSKNHIKLQVNYFEQVGEKIVAKMERNTQSKQNNGSESNIVLFKCQRCVKVFKSITALSAHNVTHQKASVYRCKKCDISFLHLSLLKKHSARAHSQHLMHKCPQCAKLFESSWLLDDHMNIHSGKTPFNCSVCSLSFAERITMTAHKIQTHKIKNFSCGECGGIFSRMGNLRTHMFIQHRQTQPQTIQKDGKNAQCHSVTHRKAAVYRCKKCCNSFSHLSLLNYHFAQEHRSHSCLECGLTFAKLEMLSLHKYQMHTNKDYPCGDCGTVYSTVGNLRSHMFTQHKKSFWCEQCGNDFTCQVDLEEHRVAIHCKKNEMQSFECGKCRKYFASQSLLNKHIETHTKRFDCPDCDKSCKTKWNLKQHRRIHKSQEVRGLEKVNCEQCIRSFRSIKDLKRHTLRMHIDHKPVECVHCKKFFATPRLLNQHIATHITARPFKCSHIGCHSAFRTQEQLYVHSNIHYRVQSDKSGNSEADIDGCKQYPLYCCLYCKERFVTFSEAQTHIKSHGELKLEPVQMNSVFSMNNRNLTSTCSATDDSLDGDTDIKPHACLQCSQCFSSESDFDAHIKTHIKPMDCFGSPDEQILIDNENEESKPFHCLQCNKCYSTSSDLETHKNVHTSSDSMKCFNGDFQHIKDDENPMDCDDTKLCPCLACHTCFTSNSDLEAHMQTHIHVNV